MKTKVHTFEVPFLDGTIPVITLSLGNTKGREWLFVDVMNQLLGRRPGTRSLLDDIYRVTRGPKAAEFRKNNLRTLNPRLSRHMSQILNDEVYPMARTHSISIVTDEMMIRVLNHDLIIGRRNLESHKPSAKRDDVMSVIVRRIGKRAVAGINYQLRRELGIETPGPKWKSPEEGVSKMENNTEDNITLELIEDSPQQPDHLHVCQLKAYTLYKRLDEKPALIGQRYVKIRHICGTSGITSKILGICKKTSVILRSYDMKYFDMCYAQFVEDKTTTVVIRIGAKAKILTTEG